MNNIEEYTVKDLWVDSFDSHNTRSENLSTRVYSEGVIPTDPYWLGVTIKQPYINYIVQGDYQAKAAIIALFIDADSNPEAGSFIDVIIQSTTDDVTNPNYGLPPASITIVDDDGVSVLGQYTATGGLFFIQNRSSIIRCVRLSGNTYPRWRTYLLNQY